jgi:feruloyl-CoA synthase
VVTGHDREEVGLLIFPSPAAKDMDAAARAQHIRHAMQAMRADGAGSSQAPTRALVLDEPPNADAGEITDKGYLNQRAVLTRRASDVIALYSPVLDARVVRL